jgi:hypothetical protein
MREDEEWQRECVRRVPELSDQERVEEHEYHRWCAWIEELDEMDGEAVAADLEECQEYMDGVRWIEDDHGGAVYVEPVYGDDEEGELPPSARHGILHRAAGSWLPRQ